jgi:hypothetical protein
MLKMRFTKHTIRFGWLHFVTNYMTHSFQINHELIILPLNARVLL